MKIYEVNNKNIFNFSCIYLFVNLTNNKVYVGQTKNFYNRMSQYRSGREKDRVIGKAIEKYGFENFEIFILEKDLKFDDLDEREQYWMDFYKSYDNNIGYNICKEANSTKGYRHTKETKEKMSKIKKEFFNNHPDFLCGENNPMYGKHPSQQTREKMSKSRIGNKNAKGCSWSMTEEQKEKHRIPMLGNKNCLGRKLSEETKIKIGNSNKGRIVTQETRNKISNSNKGKTSVKVLCVENNLIYNSITEVSKTLKIDGSSISKCCRGKQLTAGGFHWEYINE